MWMLKYEFIHRDCKYLPRVDELSLELLTYPLSHYRKGKSFFITAIHIVKGDLENVRKYMRYLKKISERFQQISFNSAFTLKKIDLNLKYYSSLYNPNLIFPTPVSHKNGKEKAIILSWDKEPLVNLINNVSKNEYTYFFKILILKEENPKDIFLLKFFGTLTKKQRELLDYARNSGYYGYPRKIDLKKISEHFHINKSSCHETLRRAEANIFEEFGF
jgi:predicted DNA binding protein